MTITTTEARAMRERLEDEITSMLVEYQQQTGLRVTDLGVKTVHSETHAGAVVHIITGVTVTVEV